MTRNQLIQLIHIAKTQLALDDDTYRMQLKAETGQTSCKQMNIKQLQQVLSTMESKGFKRHPFKRNSKQRLKGRLSPRSGNAKHATIDKIRAIWITMYKQGHIRDGSEDALNRYVQRMTKRNNGAGVACVAWLDASQAYTVLEGLKKWQDRIKNVTG